VQKGFIGRKTKIQLMPLQKAGEKRLLKKSSCCAGANDKNLFIKFFVHLL